MAVIPLLLFLFSTKEYVSAPLVAFTHCKAAAVMKVMLKMPKMKPKCARKWFRLRLG